VTSKSKTFKTTVGQHWKLSGILVVLAVGLLTAAVASSLAASPRARAATTTTVMVPASSPATGTGIMLTAGEGVTIEASGKAKYGSLATELANPKGFSFGQTPSGTGECGVEQYNNGPFAYPGLNCYGMVFKIGASGVAFPTGTKITFTSPVSSELFLGMNDATAGYSDNSGSWTAKIKTP